MAVGGVRSSRSTSGYFSSTHLDTRGVIQKRDSVRRFLTELVPNFGEYGLIPGDDQDGLESRLRPLQVLLLFQVPRPHASQ